jgi:copper chaperone CopZ
MKTSVLKVGGLLSALGARGVEKRLRRVGGVEEVSVNSVAGAALVAYDQEVTGPAELKRAIEGCGYHCPGEFTPHHLTAKRRHVAKASTQHDSGSAAQTSAHHPHATKLAADAEPAVDQPVEHEKVAQPLASSVVSAPAVRPADTGIRQRPPHLNRPRLLPRPLLRKPRMRQLQNRIRDMRSKATQRRTKWGTVKGTTCNRWRVTCAIASGSP